MCNFSCQLCLTFNVRHNEHLRLGKSLLEVVEVDGAVKGDEAYLCPRVSRKPRTQKTSTKAKGMAYFKYIYKALFEHTPEICISTVFKAF